MLYQPYEWILLFIPIIYSIFRFIVEFVRVPDSHIGYLWSDWLTMGQLLSVPMVFFGVLLLFNINRRQLK